MATAFYQEQEEPGLTIRTLKTNCHPQKRFVECRDLADRKSTRLNSSHANISYAVFCLKKKKLIVNNFNTNKLVSRNENIQHIQSHRYSLLIYDKITSTNVSLIFFIIQCCEVTYISTED